MVHTVRHGSAAAASWLPAACHKCAAGTMAASACNPTPSPSRSQLQARSPKASHKMLHDPHKLLDQGLQFNVPKRTGVRCNTAAPAPHH